MRASQFHAMTARNHEVWKNQDRAARSWHDSGPATERKCLMCRSTYVSGHEHRHFCRKCVESDQGSYQI